ncbi:MAG: hypothetical protein ABI680_08020, partial [Chthoniobacteraceae bacterium]
MLVNHTIVSLFGAALLFCANSAAASSPGVEIIPDVVYGHKAGMALTFDVVKPKANATGSAVLLMVSGGWVSIWFPPDKAYEEAAKEMQQKVQEHKK